MRRCACGYGLVALVLAVSVGCGSGDGPNRGTQCGQVLQAACNRLGGDCAVFPSNQISACVQSGVGACCGGNCSAAVISTQAEISACVTAINSATCATLDVTNGGTLPPNCQGVVRSALAAATSALRPADSSPGARAGALMSR